MRPIAVFYHCLFCLGNPPEPLLRVVEIVRDQMQALRTTGLAEAASHILVGINGGEESECLADAILPGTAQRVMHGLKSRCENLTIVELEKWLPAHDGWDVLYFHCKGSVTQSGGPDFARRWRDCMMNNLIGQWRKCVRDLAMVDSVGCHWMPGMVDGTQNIWAGNFWWAKSEFLRSLPSIYQRDRITQSGIGAYESRYESEVWIGNGPRLPRVIDYHPGGPFGNSCP